VALQLAIKALDLKGEIITTPFSYVATTSSIVWENARPIFVDIDQETFTIDATKIERAITPKTSAILATHVYGIPCAVEAIQVIAEKNNLKVIYDAAHAFGVKYRGKSLLNYGDISTLSFHATKLFHTVEGGGLATNNDDFAHRISYMRNFGHNGQEEFFGVGINGKNSELHAAMGLCNYPYITSILNSRKAISEMYDQHISRIGLKVKRPFIPEDTDYNYSYYPILFESEEQLMKVRDYLVLNNVYPRRYFYPSLNHLPYLNKNEKFMVADSISSRILCLPLYYDMKEETIALICSYMLKSK
jgi:dTDP-4-amino-4,6-dideoxygalactose transaminase